MCNIQEQNLHYMSLQYGHWYKKNPDICHTPKYNAENKFELMNWKLVMEVSVHFIIDKRFQWKKKSD